MLISKSNSISSLSIKSMWLCYRFQNCGDYNKNNNDRGHIFFFAIQFYLKRIKYRKINFSNRGHQLFSVLSLRKHSSDERKTLMNVSLYFSQPFSVRTVSTRCCYKTVMLMTQQSAAASHYFSAVLSVLCQSSVPTRHPRLS